MERLIFKSQFAKGKAQAGVFPKATDVKILEPFDEMTVEWGISSGKSAHLVMIRRSF